MKLFVVYGPNGEILQSNLVYQPDGYDRTLERAGHKFVQVDKPEQIFAPDTHHVRAGSVVERDPMPIRMRADKFKVNGSPLEILNVPHMSRVTISVMGRAVTDEVIDDSKLLLESPVPGFFDIRIEKWPFVPWTARVEAVA